MMPCPSLTEPAHHPLQSQEEVRSERAATSMAKSHPHPPHCDQLIEEDYIDIDISEATFVCYTMASPLNSHEFEFQMSSHPPDKDTTTSPADELFYQGKLLPLHLPPRLQMVQMLLQNSTRSPYREPADTSTTATTPFESCNISPAESCYVSGELNADEYFYEYSEALIKHSSKKSWSRKLKLIKHSSLCSKLKASRAFLKSLFSKSRCSDDSCTISRTKDCSSGYPKARTRTPSGQIQSDRWPASDTATNSVEEDCSVRRSFSGVIKWHSKSKSPLTSPSCSSSSYLTSVDSKGLRASQTFKRSTRVNSELENSIQGAIAYCKNSHQPTLSSRKSFDSTGFRSLSASRIAAASENKENPRFCRG